ncbi:hypothetical protein G6F56_011649 [Rhizopus delemar]|nr:hypothetical protein G6F56_011649 [Rhizopus delemar]
MFHFFVVKLHKFVEFQHTFRHGAGLSNCSIDVPLEPSVAFELFLTQQARSIISALCNDDPTIKLLYNLANEHYENIAGNQLHLVEVIGQMCDHQNSEYEKLLELIDNKAPASLLIQTIKSAQSRTRSLKRKYVEIDETDTNIAEATTAATEVETSTQQIQPLSSLSYEQGMQFVEQFKQARIEKGLTKMDWLTCLSEGQKKNLLHYKNCSTLRNQFARRMMVT